MTSIRSQLDVPAVFDDRVERRGCSEQQAIIDHADVVLLEQGQAPACLDELEVAVNGIDVVDEPAAAVLLSKEGVLMPRDPVSEVVISDRGGRVSRFKNRYKGLMGN